MTKIKMKLQDIGTKFVLGGLSLILFKDEWRVEDGDGVVLWRFNKRQREFIRKLVRNEGLLEVEV